MLRRFHGGVEFSDENTGFFGFLRDTFAQLAKEEDFAARREGTQTPLEYPSFGHAADSYEDVAKPFYAAWASFSTRKTFAWRDRWRTSDAPDRRTRRMAEKENMRMREEGIREFNEAVRTLVAFVRKRDPRVQGATGMAKSEAEREKVLREVAKERAAKMRRENEEKLTDVDAVPEWARGGDSKTKEEEELEGSVGSEEESEDEQYECVACRKTFKSENQFDAHERSKKHQKAVAALRKKLKKEGVALDLDEEDDESAGVSGAVTPAVDAHEVGVNGFEHDDDHESNRGDVFTNSEADAHSLQDPLDEDFAQAIQEPMETLQVNSDAKDFHNSDEATKPADIEGNHENNDDHDDDHDKINDDDSTDSEASTPQPKQKLGKAAQKRAKKAAQADAASQEAEELQHKCASCRASFPSRTRLFQHIKDHGHAAPVPIAKKKKGKR